jgi:hypothetical protein
MASASRTPFQALAGNGKHPCLGGCGLSAAFISEFNAVVNRNRIPLLRNEEIAYIQVYR